MGIATVAKEVPSEQDLATSANDAEAFGGVQLARILSANDDESARQSAFDCLELWGTYPDHIEPLYAAARLLHQCGSTHLGLMVAEYATTMRARSTTGSPWPLSEEATGWQMDLLYARLLVTVGRVSEAMAFFGSVLSSCDPSTRRDVADEVAIAARQLELCRVRVV